MAVAGGRLGVPVPEVPAGQDERGSLDLYSRLLHDRVVVIREPIDDQVANGLIAQLLYLESVEPDRDIALYLTCPGGWPWAVLAVLDVMEYVACDIATVASGVVAGPAVVLLARGASGKRSALPHAQIILEQPATTVEGDTTDIEQVATEALRIWDQLIDLLVEATGRDRDEVAAAYDRRRRLDAGVAVDFGLIDTLLHRR